MSIVITKDTCGGHPRIAGRRIEVFVILGYLAEGMTIKEIAEQYKLTEQQVKEAIEWAKDYVYKQFEL